jgi:hypothetical protein
VAQLERLREGRKATNDPKQSYESTRPRNGLKPREREKRIAICDKEFSGVIAFKPVTGKALG